MNAICPFCECPVMHGGVEFGGSLLHDHCFATLQQEMARDEDMVEATVVFGTDFLLENYDDGECGEASDS